MLASRGHWTLRSHTRELQSSFVSIVSNTFSTFDIRSATAAKSIQQADRMWAGRAGRGVIGRARDSQWWPPSHSTNERRASRTRVRPASVRRCQLLPEKKIPDSTFLGPPVFFCLAALSFGNVYWGPYPFVRWFCAGGCVVLCYSLLWCGPRRLAKCWLTS